LRIFALDIGTRRVGVARSNQEETLALPFEVVVRTGDHQRDLGAIAALLKEEDCERVVIGLPLGLAGGLTDQARHVLDEACELAEKLPCPVLLWDERLSSVEAMRRAHEVGQSERSMRGKLDAVAASVILEDFLGASDRNRFGEPRAFRARLDTVVQQ
jgi:putative Holliday junction resolvase